MKLKLLPFFLFCFIFTAIVKSQIFTGDGLLHSEIYDMDDFNSWKTIDIQDSLFNYNGTIKFEEDKIIVNLNSIIDDAKTDYVLKFRDYNMDSKNIKIISGNFGYVPTFLLEDYYKNKFDIQYYSWNSLGADIGFFVIKDYKKRYTYIVMPEHDVYEEVLNLYQ